MTDPPMAATTDLVTRRITVGTVCHHIFLDRYPDPLGFCFAPSRFSDPRRGAKAPFGVYYAAATYEGAFLETLVRDRRNFHPAAMEMSLGELDHWVHVRIFINQALDMVDLRGGNPVIMGIPTDAVRASSHRGGQRLSLALYRHPNKPDGISYSSRLNEAENLAIFDRSVSKLRAGPRRKLASCPELGQILDRYRINLV
jgi:hypothetical protein